MEEQKKKLIEVWNALSEDARVKADAAQRFGSDPRYLPVFDILNQIVQDRAEALNRFIEEMKSKEQRLREEAARRSAKTWMESKEK